MSIVLKESERLNKSIAEFLRFVRPQERVPSEFDIAVTLSETLDLLANSSELRPDHAIQPEINPPSFFIYGERDEYCYDDVPGCVATLAEVLDGKENVEIAIVRDADHGFTGAESGLGQLMAKWLLRKE